MPSSVFVLTKEESKNHRFGSPCIFFLVLFVDFCLGALLASPKNWVTIIKSWRWLLWSRSEFWQETLPRPYRDRLFSSVVLYTFVEIILSEWGKFCTNLERTLPGLTRSFKKKNLPFFSRETDIFDLVYSHAFLLKPFFLNEVNFVQISLANELHNV